MSGSRGVGRGGRLVSAVLGAALCVATTVSVAQTPSAGSGQANGDTKITKEQAKELFRSVDEILSFASTDSRLPIKHSVKRRLISRDEVNKFLRKKFDEDKGTKRLERSEIVLKKFGLIDRDFHLKPFLLSLLTEQIAGFYDEKSKTVNLLDWIAPDEQKPVLAHELTHALQDQTVDLVKWSSVGDEDNVSKNAKEDNEHIQTDEADTAREAVAEGQAMAVFVDYTLKPLNKTLLDAPGLLDRFRAAAGDMSGSPVLARAPLLLQESLLFPYVEGLDFEAKVMLKAGRERAFAGVLEAPPGSSFEIMNPAAYLQHTPVPVLRMPDIHPLIDPEYVPYDIGVMGELDVKILTELFGGKKIAAALAPAWDGGIYYAAQRKSATTPAEQGSTASLALLYESRWKSPAAANAFLKVYANHLGLKYNSITRRKADEQPGEQVYTTEEGDVLLSIEGSTVYIGEGFPLALSRRLRDAITAAQSSGPVEQASAPRHDPALDLSRTLASFGVMKAALPQRYTLAWP